MMIVKSAKPMMVMRIQVPKMHKLKTTTTAKTQLITSQLFYMISIQIPILEYSHTQAYVYIYIVRILKNGNSDTNDIKKVVM